MHHKKNYTTHCAWSSCIILLVTFALFSFYYDQQWNAQGDSNSDWAPNRFRIPWFYSSIILKARKRTTLHNVMWAIYELPWLTKLERWQSRMNCEIHVSLSLPGTFRGSKHGRWHLTNHGTHQPSYPYDYLLPIPWREGIIIYEHASHSSNIKPLR